MILHGFAGSPNTWKVRAFADHIGVPLEYRMIDFSKGEQKCPQFLALNPTGRTPVLVDGGFSLWESTAIMQYIGAKTPNDLWPANDRTRADIMRWQSWQLQHWSRACEPLLFERLVKQLFGMGPPDAQTVATAEAAFRGEGGMLDAHLGQHAYLVEDRLTLADFSVASYLLHAEAASLPLAELPNVVRWFATVGALPAWKNTAPRF